MNALTKQEGGSHYKNMAIQPMVYCQKNKLGAAESAVIQYVSRWREKNGLEDLKKAIHTIELLIEIEELEKPAAATQTPVEAPRRLPDADRIPTLTQNVDPRVAPQSVQDQIRGRAAAAARS